MMEGLIGKRKIELRFVLILAFVTIAVAASGFILLYQMTLKDKKAELVEIVKSQARLMEAVGKFDAFFHGGDIEGASRAATLSQIRESHRKYTGFGKTGEIVLAERRGSRIVFLLPTRKRQFRIPNPIDLDSRRARLMKLALSRKSGVVEAVDHSGERVLAAYEYLPFLEMVLVAQIDKTEILEPFLKAGLISGSIAILLILVGTFLNFRIVSPLITKIYDFALQIKEREERYRSLVSNIPGAVYHSLADGERTMVYVSEPIKDLTGYEASDFIDNKVRSFISIVHPDDAEILRRAYQEYLETGKSYSLEYRIFDANGDEKWVYEQGSILTDPATKEKYLDGVMIDITDRKKAEQALAELPRKLSKYLSPQVYKSIFEGTKDVKIGSARKKLTVFFSDIAGFTSASDNMEPEDLSYIINTYLNRMAEIAIEYGGTLDKFIGDGILIFFGDPESKGVKEDAVACVNMALEMRRATDVLCKEWLNRGIDVPMKIRIGITSGFCTVGNFGSENRMDYTILGRNVNLASRLESNTEPGTILISHETYILVGSHVNCIKKDPIFVKGFEQPVQTYQVVERTDMATVVEND
jgi:PAS domain S-box-containing protein